VILTPYATLFRYPEACPEPSSDDAEEALSLATMLLIEIGQEINP